jgi:hypothetical protein
MAQLGREEMREYQRRRRKRLKAMGGVNTVEGVLALVRSLEDRVEDMESRVVRVEASLIQGGHGGGA